MQPDLATLIASVPDQPKVYAADLAAAREQESPVVLDVVPDEPVKTPEDIALDGVAYHVFNTLRGAEDTVFGATFEDVRAAIAVKGVA